MSQFFPRKLYQFVKFYNPKLKKKSYKYHCIEALLRNEINYYLQSNFKTLLTLSFTHSF